MSKKQSRYFFRYMHLLAGALITAYIYSPTLQDATAFAGLIQFILLPFLALSGLWLWQLPRVNKWRARRQAVTA